MPITAQSVNGRLLTPREHDYLEWADWFSLCLSRDTHRVHLRWSDEANEANEDHDLPDEIETICGKRRLEKVSHSRLPVCEECTKEIGLIRETLEEM